jgi:hypothetical protein
MKRLIAGGMVVAVVALGACTPAAAPVVKTISLRVEGTQGTPGEASVIVDDEEVGQLDFVQAHGVALPPGVHHVTVRADGYFPWDKEVEAKQGSGPIKLEVGLRAIPD